MYRLTNLTRVAALGALAAVASCNANRDVLGPDSPPGGDIFKSYVAIGNSITAGYQSGGIMDSTQQQSYARLLARAMGTQYHYPSLAGRGCAPPIINTQTGARFGTGSTATTCDLRNPVGVSDVLNNVAVPGANSYDPTSNTGIRPLVGTVLDTTSNTLTTLFLGGKTQVARALDARPTFVSIWIGNNDVLQPALSGLYQPIKTSQAQFQTNYDAMIKGLTDSMPNLKGLLIGVAKAQYLPTMVAAPTITTATMTSLAGKPVTVDAGCATSTSLVNVVSLVQAIRANTHPALVACSKGIYPAPVGDVYILDAAEQVTLNAAIDAYNNYISTKAAAINFAYYDPNILFAAQRAPGGGIPSFPNFSSGTATFGTLISLDGVHPTAAAHLLLANAMIPVINAKYGTALALQ